MSILTSPALQSKSLWSYNPIPYGCALYQPLWNRNLSGPVFKSPDPFGHTATVSGASCIWTGDGREFDGTDDTIIVPNHASLNFGATQDFTLMGWAKTAVAGAQYLIFKGDIGAGLNNFTLRMEGANKAVQAWIDDGTTIVNVPGTTDLSDDVFHLYAATFDRDGNLTVYADGVPEGVPAAIGAVGDIDDAEDLYISGRISGGAQGVEWNGTIGESWIYNRLLSVGEILHTYNSTRWRYS